MTEWTVLQCLYDLMQIDEQETAAVLPLCRSALQQIRQRLRAQADPQDERIARAAAGVAFYNWTLRKAAQDDNVTSFKAGDVTVSRSTVKAMDYAAEVRRRALSDLLPLLEDSQFVFRCV